MATATIAAPGATPPAWHALSVEEALAAQAVDENVGLSTKEIEARQATYGLNKFADAPKEARWRGFLRQYSDPMQIVLLAAGILSMFIPDQFATGVLLVLLTLLNAFLGMSQEGKASASVAALQKMMVVKSRVKRGGQVEIVDMDQIVPGDIVMVEAGGLAAPARGRSPPATL